MIRFIIKNKDFGNHIIGGSYKIDKVESYESWIDGNYKEHRIKTSEKVKGSFDMFFRTIEDFQEFQQLVDETRNDDMTNTVRLTMNKTDQDVICDVFMSYSPIRGRDGSWKDYFERFSVEVMES